MGASKGRRLSPSQTPAKANGREPEWRKQCVKTGLATGEALINEIRDERSVIVKGKKDKLTGEAETLIEPGVSDKRALVLDEEFSRLLRERTAR
jgi:hypothetical protein